MEIKNKKLKRTFTGLGLAIGLTGWSLLAWGCTQQDEEVKESKPAETAKEEVSSTKGDPNLGNSIKAFLQSWMVNNKAMINILITENFDSVSGYHAYPVTITKTGNVVGLDLGLSKIEVPENNLTVYRGFNNTISKFAEGDTGLAIVKYNNNNIERVEVYKLQAGLSEIQDALLNTELENKSVTESSKEKKELKTYKSLTAEDWKGMTLLASRDIINKEMAPIFIVPNASLSAEKDLEGTFYYIIAGELIRSDDHVTELKSYEGKKISLDFGIKGSEEHVGKPVWIHAVTENGEIKNIEMQSFEGANTKTMAEGMLTYISTASVIEFEE